MKPKPAILLAAALALLILAAAPARAYVLSPYNWNYLFGSPKTVMTMVNPNCADPSAPNELASIQACMNTWTTAGANFAFYYDGYTSVTTYQFNGMNTICWNSGSSGGALATTYMWGQGSNMLEADIVFWDGQWTWSTAASPGFLQFDVESVGLHELGHVLGLDHSQYSAAVMWYSIGYMEVQRTLHSDDVAGLMALYGAGTPNLSVDVNPTGSTTVPASGGTIPYTISLHNNGMASVNFDAWTLILNSSGASMGYVLQRPNITMPAGGIINRTAVLSVSGTLPAGSYTYHARLGDYIGAPTWYAQDSFPFTKSGDDAGGPFVWETASTGWEETVTLAPVIPERFAVSGAHPNPFNPETSIEFDLPAFTHLALEIYDVQGRRVAELLRGSLQAGHYGVVWNAADQPSGTYLYRLSSEAGQATGKLLLVK
ncbi:MAG: T9SS C-terminal target domain-containing protein [Candidatus Zixiibacteriota bacterium]|nr:MAG: T9SS C-terminal target domain-containing protein [candidate division Zixibacteria bacterium]